MKTKTNLKKDSKQNSLTENPRTKKTTISFQDKSPNLGCHTTMTTMEQRDKFIHVSLHLRKLTPDKTEKTGSRLTLYEIYHNCDIFIKGLSLHKFYLFYSIDINIRQVNHFLKPSNSTWFVPICSLSCFFRTYKWSTV